MIIELISMNNAIWDAGLAVVAVLLSYAIVWVARSNYPKPLRAAVVAPLTAVWLAFLPNTCYLITEWRHFMQMVDRSNLFLRAQYDIHAFTAMWTLWLFYLLFSGFGVITFALSVRPMKHLAARHGAAVWFWVMPFFTMLSVGVFLGLVMRFNSWDLATKPGIIWSSVVQIGRSPKLMALIVSFGLFLWLAFEALDIWIDGLAERLSKLTGRRIHLGPKVD